MLVIGFREGLEEFLSERTDHFIESIGKKIAGFLGDLTIRPFTLTLNNTY
jgi:hypothetical protein